MGMRESWYVSPEPGFSTEKVARVWVVLSVLTTVSISYSWRMKLVMLEKEVIEQPRLNVASILSTRYCEGPGDAAAWRPGSKPTTQANTINIVVLEVEMVSKLGIAAHHCRA